jgi:hypothetical protein
MNKSFKFLIVVLTLITFSQLATAGGPPPPPANPAAVPIDGGLGFLLAAGVGLGAKKAWNLRKK